MARTWLIIGADAEYAGFIADGRGGSRSRWVAHCAVPRRPYADHG